MTTTFCPLHIGACQVAPRSLRKREGRREKPPPSGGNTLILDDETSPAPGGADSQPLPHLPFCRRCASDSCHDAGNESRPLSSATRRPGSQGLLPNKRTPKSHRLLGTSMKPQGLMCLAIQEVRPGTRKVSASVAPEMLHSSPPLL